MFKTAFYYIDVFVANMNKTIAVLGMALGVLIAFANVVLRYVFDGGLSWAGDLSNFCFIWSALFGAAYGFKKGIHISVTILLARFPHKIAKFFMVCANVFSCLFLAFLSYLTVKFTIMTATDPLWYEEVPSLEIAVWIPMLVLPISFAAAAFRTGEKVFEIYNTPADKVIKKSEEEFVHDSIEKE